MMSASFKLILLLVVIELATSSDLCHGGDLEDEIQHLRATLEGNRIKTKMALDCIFAKINETCPTPSPSTKSTTAPTTTDSTTTSDDMGEYKYFTSHVHLQGSNVAL